MGLQLHHPKLLACVLLAIAAVTTVGLLFANGKGDEEGFTPIPVEDTLPILTESEIEEAVSIIRTSGVVKTINGNQHWSYELVNSQKYDGFEGAGMDVVWDNPVASSGPWALTGCQGTRKLMTFADWSNVTRLEMLVDLENDEVVAFVPMSGDTEAEQPALVVDSHGDKSAKVYDVITGELLFDGTKDGLDDFDMCPDGKDDEVGK